MKNLILMFLFILTGAMASNAQTSYVKADDGTLVQTATIHTEQEAIGTSQPNGESFKATDGKVYPVYVTAKGRKVIIRTAKSGNHYKVYIDEKK